MFLIASCFHCDIWLGLISNSLESSASVFCSLIAAKATLALNLFMDFLRFVVFFPNVLYPLQNYSFFTLTHALNSGVHYSFSGDEEMATITHELGHVLGVGVLLSHK